MYLEWLSRLEEEERIYIMWGGCEEWKDKKVEEAACGVDDNGARHCCVVEMTPDVIAHIAAAKAL